MLHMYKKDVLLCIYMHRVCGTICEVDPIDELIWSKVCITKTITKTTTTTITTTITITTQKLSPPFNRTITIAIAICEVDPIEELIWSKVRITKAITITTQKLSPPFNRTITIAIAT